MPISAAIVFPAELGNPILLSCEGDIQSRESKKEQREQEAVRSERRPITGWITATQYSERKQTYRRSSVDGEVSMTDNANASITPKGENPSDAPKIYWWSKIDWQKAEEHVKRMQTRISKEQTHKLCENAVP